MKKIESFIESHFFQNFILIIIVINCIIMGAQTSSYMNIHYGNILTLCDKICLGIFVGELLLKLIVYKNRFFKSGWNLFDTLIVLISILSDFSYLSTMRVFRVFRVFRSLKAMKSLKSLRGLRLISGIEKLQVIVVALINSIPSILWAGGLLMLIYYIFAIMGVSLFGTAFPEWFGSLGKAMYTLFQVMTLESWSMGISRPVMKVYPLAWIYFVPFVLTSSFIVMNVVVGIVVNSISEVAQINRVEKIEKDDIDYNIEMEVQVIKEHLANLEALMKKKHNE
ncbi:MAG: ion transporter [Oscillospiraceae bacterium]|nr:ion transporter [Oscillospiraceae bacterium]